MLMGATVLFENDQIHSDQLKPGQQVLVKITRLANEICFSFMRKYKKKEKIDLASGYSKAECFQILLAKKNSLSEETIKVCLESIQHNTGGMPFIPKFVSNKKKKMLEKFVLKSQKFLI